MTGMLADLVNSVADEFRTALGAYEPANDEGEQLFDRLRSAGLLDIPDLVALLLRHAEEEHISAGIRAARGGAKLRFLQSLVSDEDLEVSAAAMALILAIGRRRDRFGGPRVTFDDISAEAATALVNARLQRDFAREWVDSLRVKEKRPLGEEKLARMLQGSG